MAHNVWEADKMLDSYIYDYLLKRNLQNTAKAFQAESNVPSAPVSIDAPGGFLFEWWSVFWDVFIARTNEKHSDSATSYLESIKAREQQQQSQHQIQTQQLLLQRHAQQHPQEQQQWRQQKQQQRSENTDFPTSAQNGTVAADPPARQNDTTAGTLSAKVFEDRMKITVQRDVSEETSMKQRLTETICPLLESNPTSMLKSPARSSLASGPIFQRSAGGMSGSLQQAQFRSQPLLGSTQDIKAETNVALNQRAAGADGSLFGVPGSNQAGNNLTLKGWPLTGLEQLRSGFLQHKSYMYPAQPLQHQLQFLTPQQQHALIHVQAQQNATSPGDMDNRRLRMLFSSRNLVPGRDGQSTGFTEIVPSVGQSLQNMCLPMQRTETDMLMKIAALQQQQPSNNLQQLLQHPLLSQQQQSSTYLEGEQEKMGAGIVTVAFAGNEQVSKNRNGRKRKHPISSSGPANSSGTTNTAGASPSSTPSTLSAHSPGETISTPLQHQNASSCTTLVVYGSEGPVPIGSPTNQLVDMDHYTEDDSMEDNLEPFLPHNGTNPRAAGSHCISSGKGYILREVSSAQASTSSVLCCHFSSDGKLIATGGHDKKVFLWNADTLKQKSMLEEHSLLITDVRFSPSTPRLATSSFDKTVRVWDADNHGYSIRTFTGHSASVMSLDFHPNKDDLICSCDGDNEIRFWSIKHGNAVRIFKGGSTQLRFQPRYGGLLATASDNVVSILDVERQACVRRFESHTKGVDSVCWDPTGEYVVSVSEDTVKVWSLNDESFVNELSCGGRKFSSCTFHPTYPSLLIIGCYQSLELWDMSENRSMTVAAHDSLVSALASSSSGLVASSGHDKYVKLWR
ncbi:transcriptional corepressor LEUNIG isoform X4 [Zea mays]|uniref:Transcriptional corepressor LEUNIG n=1 Tax=Zea mays TaxID=4577 RepID=A0A804QMN8_MAIZE|nr:transcriptional corepressor LEUNIG isoform X4 [Zea mays]